MLAATFLKIKVIIGLMGRPSLGSSWGNDGLLLPRSSEQVLELIPNLYQVEEFLQA
jgi:hypothetical protein